FDAQNSLALTYQCIAYTALDQNETALDICNDALRVDGDWGNRSPALAWRYRGNILEQAEQDEQALVAYERTLLLEPDDSLTLAYQCRAYVNLGQYEQAIDACQSARSGNGHWQPENPGFAWYYEGVALTHLERYNPAIAAYDQSLEIDPNNAQTWTYQGLVLEKLNQFTEALTSYTRAVELAPTSSRALVGQCTMMNRLQQYEAADAACQQAIQGDGQWWSLGAAQAWNQRAHALAGQNKYEEALAAVNRAVGMQPDYAAAWNTQGVIFWYIGTLQQGLYDTQGASDTYQQAIVSVGKALELEPNDSLAWANLGRYYRTLAQLWNDFGALEPAAAHFQNALAAYDQALKLAPNDTETWVNKSVVHWFLGDYIQSRDAANRAVALDPNLAVAWQTQGAALVALGDYESALISYQNALLRDDENADAWAGLGVVNLQLEDIEAGMAALKRALQLNPNQAVALKTLALIEEQQAATTTD
ncbi:MAG: tetratricopeptide repeat protein, partial [Cyanobacteria bacterium P01_A01_bin.114]